ncbi:sirohydrochlorin ferrochelatase, chloroplastic isoform X4 [Henckelia pumila]|uniref:sirohydrochlorin ferrochelatase, chloroplastic isoform X4 n=1 Tax=Henckelia pumila TaxID=405737 RepID=UPI003C6E18A1
MEAAAASSSLVFPSEIGRGPIRAIPGFVKLRLDPLKTEKLRSGLCLATANGGFRKALNGVAEGDGVIIVDHGSRRDESNLMLNEFVDMFRERTKYPIVEPAHMELAAPSIKDAFDLCVQQGAKRVIVSPFFLSPGRHWNRLRRSIQGYHTWLLLHLVSMNCSWMS